MMSTVHGPHERVTVEPVNHSCYKCGAMVEEGAPFCPNCRAPQIRVNIPVSEQAAARPPDAPATPAFPPGTPGEIQPPAVPVPLKTSVRLRDALGSALGPNIIVLSCLVVFPPLLLLVLGPVGAFAVRQYSRRQPHASLTAGRGAQVGALSGLVSSALFTFLFVAQFLADHGAVIRQNMTGRITASAAANPEVAKWWLEHLNEPDFFAGMVVFGVVFSCLIIVALSAIGGAVAGKVLSIRRG